jgi:hypothetical protein
VAPYSTGRPLGAFLTIPTAVLYPRNQSKPLADVRGADGGGVPADSSFGFTNAGVGQDAQRKKTELAGMLGITPQGVTEIFKGRNQPTGEQVLVMLELMKARR